MNKDCRPPGEEYTIRCPRLGHQISFTYCRTESRGLPCFKTLDCWFEHFPVQDCLRATLTEREWAETFENPPKHKMLSLVELIEQAKKKKKE